MANPASEKTLQEELQYAIRHDHLIINHLISSRMPLCLPPKTDNPLRFALGLTAFAHLYTSFEYAWETITSQASKPPAYLLDLQTTGLTRHLRLDRDLRSLAHLVGSSGARRMQRIRGQTVHFQRDIFHLCQNKPHLILAWAWTMYLAIFNGGRYIRAGLEDAGDDFWGTKIYPLEFWNFEGKDDGATIHEAFKKNFDQSAEHLTRHQKDEVIAEAKRVFHVVEDVVHELDKKVGQGEALSVVTSLAAAVNPVTVAKMVFGLFSWGWCVLANTFTAWRRPLALSDDTRLLEKA
jgi:heme oxygenase